jgi:hypothetical protein
MASASSQGYQGQINYRFLKKFTFGINAGYRFQKNDPKPTRNIYSFLTYNNIPGINASATVSTTLIQTAYFSGSVYSLGISRDFYKGKLYGSAEYRYATYKYNSLDSKEIQHMAGLSLSWRVLKKLSLSVDYDGTFENQLKYGQLYVNLNKNF